MKKTVLLAVVLLAQTAFCRDLYPKNPDSELTPGQTCEHADSFRYPERIPYCDRDVDSKRKATIIATYDRVLHYRIGSMPRPKFKIDHYIPLCMGGSNDTSNLWPQHESVYKITDSLEQKICEKMAEGKILQSEAIDLIKQAKNHLDEAPAILAQVSLR